MRTTVRIGALAAASALALAACTSSGPDTDTAGPGTLVIATDLPLQGTGAAVSESTNRMIRLLLDLEGQKAGDYDVALKEYDNSTAEKGSWDNATCARNAQAHVTTPEEIAVMGTYDSGCAKIIVPVLNLDPNGPMLMVSHANTNPGLTKAWDPFEPESYYPGKSRNFARVVTTDDHQGAAGAQFMAREQKVKKCFVIHDGETYGRGIATAFADEAKDQGIEVLGNEAWDPRRSSYEAFFQQVKKRGPDCIFVGGTFANNGAQVIKDKVEVLGGNKRVPMMAPDGFSGYQELREMPQAQGMYLTLAGLDLATLTKKGRAKELAAAYEAEYGQPLPSANALYGAAATQVILGAISRSDGTRESVRDEVFKGDGVTIAAKDSAIGKEFSIDPKTGDVNNRDITVLRITDEQETVVKSWQVK